MHVPERTCVGCRARAPKRDLLRVVRGPEGVRADPGGKAPGRGAYVHRDRECLRLAVRRGALSRALRAVLPPEDLARLQRELEGEAEA